MKRWGVAVLGSGNIAEFHLRSIGEIERLNLIGVFSRSEAKVKAVAEKYGCAWSTSAEELVARPDVELVHIVTSSGSHAELAKLALEHGKHVWVEKPITMKPEEAQELIELAQSKNLILSVVSQRRFEPAIQAAKAAVDAGHLGRLLLVEVKTPYFRGQDYYDSAPWRGTIAEDGGALMNQGIHQIDLLLWFGGKVKRVFGKAATLTHQMEAEDLGLALLTFEDSQTFGTIMSSTSTQPGYQATIHLYGEKGSILIKGSDIEAWNVPGIPAPESDQPQKHGGGASDPLSFPIDNHKRQLEDVLEALETDKRPLVAGEDGHHAIEVIHAIYESSRTGKEIVIG